MGGSGEWGVGVVGEGLRTFALCRRCMSARGTGVMVDCVGVGVWGEGKGAWKGCVF